MIVTLNVHNNLKKIMAAKSCTLNEQYRIKSHFRKAWDIFELIVLLTIVQIVNRRRGQAMSARPRSTGAAAASASLLIGSRRSISAVVRVRTLSGTQLSKLENLQTTLTDERHIISLYNSIDFSYFKGPDILTMSWNI